MTAETIFKTMKAKVVALMALIALSMSLVFAQEKFQVAEVDQILASPDQYRGKIVALHGVIEKVALEQRTFTVVDSKSDSSTRGASAKPLPVNMQGGSQVDIPKPGQEIVVIGQIEDKGAAANFIATQVFTNRDEVQQILAHGSITPKPGKRPGDNLGRDAQPGRDR
jgi:cytochrome c-type biogenesis protein CcmE